MDITKYMDHLPDCYIKQDWEPAREAMSLTPYADRDESYYIALNDIDERASTCTCGLEIAKKHVTALPELMAAAEEFIRKVESGEARSTRSYAAFKAALNKANGTP